MDGATWNRIISQFPEMSILQSWEWGQFKSNHGWKPEYKVWTNALGKTIAVAMILLSERRSAGIPIKMVYIPHGPLLNWRDDKIRNMVLDEIIAYAKEHNALFVKIDPQIGGGESYENDDGKKDSFSLLQIMDYFKDGGWIPSRQQIQFKNTCILDLKKPEEDLLAQMKQKTRYNIRIAQKKGVKVRKGTAEDLDILYELYSSTSTRDGFIIRQKKYYLDNWTLFMDSGKAVPLVAEYDNEVIAGLMLYYFNNKSWYLYGMSSEKARDKMPNYLLQWEAIKLSKAFGCTNYDLWGAPDILNPEDPMWGVYRFKEGFGCQFVQTIGAYDYPINKIQYTIFTNVLPRIQSVIRTFRKRQLRYESSI